MVLEACATSGLVLKFVIKMPGILGYVSTMTRDNPFTDVPTRGNTLSGPERARYVCNIRAPLADVTLKHDSGDVAFRNFNDSRDGGSEEEVVSLRTTKQENHCKTVE